MVDLDPIEFGPFDAQYHQRLVTEQLERELHRFILENIVPQVDHDIVEVDGTFTPRATTDEDCGPRSPFRNCFYLELRFSGTREQEHSDISLQLWYRPGSSVFEASKGSSLYVWTPSRRAEREWQKDAVQKMVEEVYAGQVENPLCPICFSDLEVARIPEYFRVVCSNGCFRQAFKIGWNGRRFDWRFKLFEPTHQG